MLYYSDEETELRILMKYLKTKIKRNVGVRNYNTCLIGWNNNLENHQIIRMSMWKRGTYSTFRTNVLLFKKVKLNIGMFSTNFDKTVENCEITVGLARKHPSVKFFREPTQTAKLGVFHRNGRNCGKL